MIWASGGVLLWLGGWWFTGRLFGVYRKAIYLEAWDRRHRGLPQKPDEHHWGAALFVLFDFGLLLLGIRSLATLLIDLGLVDADASLVMNATEWSVLVCIYLFRQGFNLHHFYHDRWRARTGQPAVQPLEAGTLRGIWQETAPVLRGCLLLAPVLAAVPLAHSLLGLDPPRIGLPGDLDGAVLWFIVPQTLLVIALAAPLARLRRLVHGGGPG
ncbi:MAG: hypothetical protein CMJ83_00565 [Planctomycetes bacterium]|nr:hypothetical protein [Planctomycetota bacterium]